MQAASLPETPPNDVGWEVSPAPSDVVVYVSLNLMLKTTEHINPLESGV